MSIFGKFKKGLYFWIYRVLLSIILYFILLKVNWISTFAMGTTLLGTIFNIGIIFIIIMILLFVLDGYVIEKIGMMRDK